MILKLGFDLGKRVELWGFEPQTSCMPWEMRKFNCRQMPARDGKCHSSRTGHAQNDGQMTVKTILKRRWITPIPVARRRQSGKVPASQQAGQTHSRTVTIREAPMSCSSRRIRTHRLSMDCSRASQNVVGPIAARALRAFIGFRRLSGAGIVWRPAMRRPGQAVSGSAASPGAHSPSAGCLRHGCGGVPAMSTVPDVHVHAARVRVT